MHSLLTVLAQSSSSSSPAGTAAGAVGGLFMCFIWLAILVLTVAGLWKTFEKAGQPGWAAIIPFYNLYLMCTIAGRPGWWLVLYFIPVVSLIIAIIVGIDTAKAFGRGTGFGIGLALLGPIFYCILGFGSAQYQGPAASSM